MALSDSDRKHRLHGMLLLAPAVLFLLAWFVWPVLQMLLLSVTSHNVNGVGVPGWTLANYVRLFTGDLYVRILLRTLRIAAAASCISVLISYPLALAIARGGPAMARLVTIVVVAPLLVNVVVRAYGWSAILSRNGALNYLIKATGLADNPPQLLYTEWAVLIACIHVYLPFMVMPLATAIGRVDRSLEEAARIAGASRSATFLKVLLPLSLPNLHRRFDLMARRSSSRAPVPDSAGSMR